MGRSDHFELHGKTAVVTGTSRGIGEAIAVELLRSGASVMAFQRGPLSAAVKDASFTLGGRIELRSVDLEDSAGLNDIAKDIAVRNSH